VHLDRSGPLLINPNSLGFRMALNLHFIPQKFFCIPEPMNDQTNALRKMALASRDCKPGGKGGGRLKTPVIKALMKQLPGKWKLKGGRQLESSFKFPDFKKALKFTNRIGEIAEEQGHHPDVFLSYGQVRIQLSTHSAGGLTENDFILAARVNGLK
jgi:4a-hydroxytetrahydrobiopterin dehydratase